MTSDNAEDEYDSVMNCTPPELRAIAESACSDLMPEKSKSAYETAYTNYITWKESHGASATRQNVLLANFKGLSETKKASTLWSTHSKLKSLISIKEKINISHYADLNAFMKKQSHRFEPKKSKVLDTDQVK